MQSKMSRLVGITLLVLPMFCLEAQTIDVVLRGQVVDIDTKDGIAYCVMGISGKDKGGVSNGQGMFDFALADVEITDTVVVRALGYHAARYTLGELRHTDNIRIALRPRSYTLTEAVVTPGRDTLVAIGNGSRTSRSFSGTDLWTEIALFMDNTHDGAGIFKEVGFYIGAEGKHKAPFRIRFYAVGPDGAPGTDLVSESIIVKGRKKREWLTVDVQDYNIEFPQEGCFVAMESIYSNDRYFYKKKILKNRLTLYGPTLGNFPDLRCIAQTWTRRYAAPWRKNDTVHEYPCKRCVINALISAKVVVN